MAGMFGFPSFKESPLIKSPKEKAATGIVPLTRLSVINLKYLFTHFSGKKSTSPKLTSSSELPIIKAFPVRFILEPV